MEKKVDVFISHHTKTCLEVTEAVCNNLESKGIRVWYAPRDTTDSYANSIVNAINQCRVFILILNKESSFSEDVLNEINLAVERLRCKEKISILPFHISSDEISNDAKYYIGRMHWIDAINPPMQDRINELVSKVAYLLDYPLKEEKEEVTKIELKSTIIFPNPNFIGRTKELERIHENITQYKRVFMMGMGGMGKTEIAKQYIRQYQSEYKLIIFTKYATNLQDMIINDQEIPIANFKRIELNGTLETNEQYFDRKLNKLKEITDENTLVVVDNFDTKEDPDLEEFLKGPYQVLFTTRNDFEYLGYPIIKIEPLETKEDQMILFENHYKRHIKEGEKETIEEIIKYIGGHTLTTELIAKLMSSKRIPPKIMLEKLKTEGITRNLEGTVNHGFEKANTIYGFISLLFDTSKLSDEEIKILCNLWMFPISGFDLETFASLIELDDCSKIDELIKKSWISYDFYLDKISLHPIIAETIKEKYHPNFETCSILIKNLTERLGVGYKKSKLEKKTYGELTKSLYDKFKTIIYKWIPTYISMCQIFLSTMEFDLGENILKDIMKIYDERNLLETKEAAQMYLEFGDLYIYRRQLEKACTFLEKAVQIYQKIKEKSMDSAYCYKFLALAYLKIDKYEEAEKLLKLSRNILENLVDEQSDEMASQYIAEARVYYLLKDYKKALELSQKSYHIFQTIDDENGPNILSPMTTLAMIYSKMENHEKAIDLAKNMIEHAEKIFKRNQLPVLNRYEVLADIYIDAKQYENAKQCLQTIVEELKNNQDETSNYYHSIIEKINKIEQENQ